MKMSPRLKDFNPDQKGQKGKKLLTILVCVLGALVALLLLLRLFHSCGSGPGGWGREVIQPTPPDPEIDDDDIIPSPDSLTYQVNRRIILIIQNTDVDPADFVKDFRKVYPDRKKYVLSSPDMILPRYVLTLPAEEKESVESVIASQFPKYDLLILPDTIFGSDVLPSDPDFSDPEKRWYFDMIGVEEAWKETMGSSDVIVAVIDDGFDLSHPEFDGKVVDPYNAVYHNSHVTSGTSGHGTHVAATAVGNANNGSGVSGIAPGCRLMPIQVGDSNGDMTTSAVIDGVLYAISKGADVVNMSLGWQFPPEIEALPVSVQKNLILNYFLEEETVWRKIFGMGISKGMTFVLAGGNENILVGIDPKQRIDGTIRVSAVQPDRYKADFSNFGPYSVLSAPGVYIFNALPGDDYGFKPGTSMASPIVAGCVARMKSKNSALTTDDIIRILQDTGIPSPSDVANIVNFKKALDAVPGDGTRLVLPVDPGCEAVRKRYEALVDELERLKREHPGCITAPDTLVLPPSPELSDITGLWKSTTHLINDDDEDLTLYFAFNGSPTGVFSIVEPSGKTFTASLDVSIDGDIVHFFQTEPATAPGESKKYDLYSTECKPNPKTRVAECEAVSQSNALHRVRFKLVKIK